MLPSPPPDHGHKASSHHHRKPLFPSQGLTKLSRAKRSRQPALAHPRCSCRTALNEQLSDPPSVPADAGSATPRLSWKSSRGAASRVAPVLAPCCTRTAASSSRELGNLDVLGLRTAPADTATSLRRAPLGGRRPERRSELSLALALALALAPARASARYRDIGKARLLARYFTFLAFLSCAPRHWRASRRGARLLLVRGCALRRRQRLRRRRLEQRSRRRGERGEQISRGYAAAAAAWRRLVRGRPTPRVSSRRDPCALGLLLSALAVNARRRSRRRRLARARRRRRCPCAIEVTAGRAAARGLKSRRRLLGVGWLEAGRRRTRARGAFIARSTRFSARSLRALGGGYDGDGSLALGVSAVGSMCLR